MFDKNNEYDDNELSDYNSNEDDLIQDDDYNSFYEETDVKKAGGKYSKGFYIAFAICLITMVSAAFLTYTSVSNFLSPDDITKIDKPQSSNDNKEADVDVKGVEKETQKETELITEEVTQTVTQAETINSNYEEQSEATTQTETTTEEIIANKNLNRPVLGKIIKEYSNSTPVYSNTLKDWRVHNAVDYKAKKGENVNAIDDGVVLEITSDSMYGTTIVVEHNSGFVAYYSNVKPTENIMQGTHISTGDVLGKIEEIPCEKSDGYHLHLVTKKDGECFNCEKLFKDDAQ